MSGSEEMNLSHLDDLTKKMYRTIKSIQEIKKTNIDIAIQTFQYVIEEQLKLMQFRKVEDKLKFKRIDDISKDHRNIFQKNKEKIESIFNEIITVVNNVFIKQRDRKDKEILIELIVLSYRYPHTAFCFLTNDKNFYKRWKKVYDQKYVEFKKSKDIKYGIVFHYIPDLKKQSVSQYEMYPYMDKSLSLKDMLQECNTQ